VAAAVAIEEGVTVSNMPIGKVQDALRKLALPSRQRGQNIPQLNGGMAGNARLAGLSSHGALAPSRSAAAHTEGDF